MFDSLKYHLKNASDAILYSDDKNFQNVAITFLYNELDEASQQSLIESQKDTETPEGFCLAPSEAANCMLDTNRTVKFVRGLVGAIEEAQNRNPGERISILYAGCGPFATLSLPVTAIFTPDDIGFTVLDIHEASIQNAKRIIRLLGLRNYFDEYVCQNALDYFATHQEKKFDVIITETMASALFDEPQAAITTKAAPLLKKNGIFVPERIVIGVKLKVYKAVNADDFGHIPVGDIFTLTKDTKPDSFSPRLRANFEIPPGLEDDLPFSIVLNTKIKVFGPHVLDEGEAGITRPVTLKRKYQKRDGSKFHISYPLGGDPKELRIRVVE